MVRRSSPFSGPGVIVANAVASFAAPPARLNPASFAWNQSAELRLPCQSFLPGKALKMWRNRTPVGQKTEVTNPILAVLGAIAILFLAVMAFSLWPNTQTVRTGPTANLPDNQKGASEAPGSPKGSN